MKQIHPGGGGGGGENGWPSDIILEIPKEEYHSTAPSTAMRQQMISWEMWCREGGLWLLLCWDFRFSSLASATTCILTYMYITRMLT